MPFPDDNDLTLPFNLDTSQAEQKLSQIQEQLISLSKQLSEFRKLGTFNPFEAQLERDISPLQRLQNEWTQLEEKIAQACASQQSFVNNSNLKDNAEQLQTLNARILATHELTEKNPLESLQKTVQGFQNLRVGNFPLGSLLKSALSDFEKLHIAFKQFNSNSTNNGKGFFAFFKESKTAQNSLLGLGAKAIDALGQHFMKGKTGLTKAIGSTLTGAAAGALAGLALGPIGALAGGALGAISGAASGGGKFDAKAGLKGLPFGLVGFAIAGFLGGAKKAKEKQKQLEATQRKMASILQAADQNDITSLQNALNQVMRYKSGGGAAFREKQAAAIQLQQAIQARQQVIDTAIKDLKFQNSALEKAFRQFDDLPLENLGIDRDIELDSLVSERDKALEQFKDSQEVQAQIQKNYELKRQALLKQSSLDIIDAVIEEQSRIRQLRAQAAIDEARVSGNALTQINAELQARLVAIDNDIAAFKGAEEAKTEFLKAKTAERNRVVKEANDQVDELLQQGLEILNEGLVVGETKAQGQQKRLEKLFGKLNPLGLIQADGNLVQSNITIGSGGIQFILDGVSDAQSLVDQLQNDPVLQGKLIAALNTALSRT